MSGTSPRADAGARWNMAALVQAALFALGAGVLAAMSIAAHSMAYFPVDLEISQDVQTYHPGWLDAATATLSWTGFPPQSDVLFGCSFVVMLFMLGQRLAAAAEAVAAIGSGGLYLLLQQLVGQPRPSADLVLVAGPIQLSGFPSVATWRRLQQYSASSPTLATEVCVHRLCGGYRLCWSGRCCY